MAKRHPTAYPPTKLTERFIESIKPPGKRIKVRDTTVPGLILRVSADATNKVFYFEYRTPTGQRPMYRIGAAGVIKASVAKAEARKIAGQVAAGGDPAGEKSADRAEAVKAEARTLGAYLEGDYMTGHLSTQRDGAATQARIRAAWKPFLNTDMTKLTAAKLRAHRAKRLKAGIAPSTLNRDRTALIALLHAAVDDNLLAAYPVPEFKPLKLDDDDRVRYLGQYENDPNERERFMVAVERAPEYFRVMVKLALLTGMRRGEILQLTWPNIDLRSQKITVRAATAKSQKTRVIQLPPAAVSLLTDWRQQQDVTDIDRHVFLNVSTGLPFTGIKRRWRALAKDADVDDFRFHDLRHDYASRLVQSGVDLYTVKELMGHSSIEMTQRYAHLADKGLQDAVKVLS